MRALDLMRGKVNHPADGTPVNDDGLDELWRPSPEFIGPVMPPMIAWLLAGRPRSQWQIDAETRRRGADEQLASEFVRAA